MLTFNLKKQWYEKIRSGEKQIEYREVKPYWTKRLELYGREPDYLICKLTLGYAKNHMTARITKIEVVNGKDTDLAIDAPVYAIHLADVREKKQ